MTRDKIRYIPMDERDRVFFIHVHHAAYRDTIEAMFGWDEGMQDKHASRAFDDGGLNIVWYDDERVGVVGWEDRGDCLWLKELFLLPKYQGCGIGSQIVQDSIQRAQSLEKDVRLRTLKANVRAKKLYERHGFEVTSVTDIHCNMSFPFA
ncbi:MAG: GNAT family N-acetyltransferase [Rhizobiales bacterium]|nr:GNAT family N-acetyltransferase [Hyphomicrobiales bacterium]MBA69851.1 GNAT family N-acetyltransferase [Hyphomicrobiales bacterium]|tara:strand:- start:227 stop:676 length:450 start_codon:yes stop_codon:yes gene_type:complete